MSAGRAQSDGVERTEDTIPPDVANVLVLLEGHGDGGGE